MTAEGVFRVLEERGVPVEHVFVADNLDPLRRVYPFLDDAVYAPLVGQSLSHIRCPCGEHPSYSEHFLAPFLRAVASLSIAVTVERADQMYASGRMDEVIGMALEGRDRIALILAEVTGKRVEPSWSPFDARCTACLRLTETEVVGFDRRRGVVSYRCACGCAGEVPFAGGGKLTWRVDWPARWRVLGVTVEPFGKDHASRGGSYDTGVRIVREVFKAEPPVPIPYEWIALKGKGDMSSSKGNVLPVHRLLEIVSAEALRYWVLKAEPRRSITFDPGLPLLQVLDEVEDPGNKNRNPRAAELARTEESVALAVPFRHLVTVVQAAGFDAARAEEVLARTGYAVTDRAALARRLDQVRKWLEEFAPEEVRFSVQPALPARAQELAAEEKAVLGVLAARLPDRLEGESLHALIHALAQEKGIPAARLFTAIYLAFIGKERGPRAGLFLAALPRAFVVERLREAAA
jgi:lysyl-tRNA synthetase class 1